MLNRCQVGALLRPYETDPWYNSPARVGLFSVKCLFASVFPCLFLEKQHTASVVGVACTDSHLLLLGTQAPHDDIRCDKLKLLLRIRRRYDQALVCSGSTLLVGVRVGTMDLFRVCQLCRMLSSVILRFLMQLSLLFVCVVDTPNSRRQIM